MAQYPAFRGGRGRPEFGRRGPKMGNPAPISCVDGEKLTRDFLAAELRRQNGVNEPYYASESYSGVKTPKNPYGDSSIQTPNPVINGLNDSGMPVPSLPPGFGTGGSGGNFEDTEIYFESTVASATSDYANGEILWDISPLNNYNDIKNCIVVNIGDFYFPKIYGTAGLPEFFYFRRVYAEILSFPTAQGILGADGNKFHFEFEVENLNSQAVRLRPVKSSFYARQPVTTMGTFRIRFMVPSTIPGNVQFKKIPIPPANVIVQLVVPGTNPARFTIIGYGTSIIAPVGAVVPGVAIIVNGLVSGSGGVDAAINNPEGIFITNVVNATTFEVGTIDATTAIIIGASAPALILKNRVAMPVRFTSVTDRPANYIAINHS